jgi:LmeA-like phospholipid-binding
VTTTVAEVPPRRHRGRRALVVLLVVVIVLVMGFFVADYFVKKYATNYVRDQIASSLGLSSTAPVSVDLGQGSILLQAAAGTIDDVSVQVSPLTLSGLVGSATLVAHGVPLSQTEPVRSLDVTVSVPETTVTTAISRIPSIAALKPVVKFTGQRAVVTGTISVFGFPQSVGATLTPKVTSGVPSFVIDSATFDGATVSIATLDRYLPGLSSLLESGTSLCIANDLPKAFALTGIAVHGTSLVSTFSGDGVELNANALSQKGTCAAN